jgi:hypothetical protein
MMLSLNLDIIQVVETTVNCAGLYLAHLKLPDQDMGTVTTGHD